MSHQRGFTLLEILVALTVFAIIASLTSSAMYHAFNTRARVTLQADRLAALQLAIAFINRDTQQIIGRSIHGSDRHTFPPFTGQPNYLEFTRGGVINPLKNDVQSTQKRVAYMCKKFQLIRRSWDVLDAPVRNHYQDRVLLDNLTECKFNYLAHNHQMLPNWHAYALRQDQRKETLPMAIQFNLTLKDWGNMRMLFIVPEALYAQ